MITPQWGTPPLPVFYGRVFKEEVHERARRVGAHDLRDIEDALTRHSRFSEIDYTVSAD